MEEAASASPSKINGANGGKNGHPVATPPAKKVETRGRKKLPADRIRPVKYNLHVTLTKEEHEVFLRLADGMGPTDFVKRLIAGAAVMHGILTPKGEVAPVPCSAGVSCTAVVS